MLNKLMSFKREEEGQGMAEYGLILAGVAVIAAAVFTDLGDAIIVLINNVIAGL